MAVKIGNVWVRVVGLGLVEVQSFTNPEKFYVVDRLGKTCSCPDFKFRGRVCKHIRFVQEHESMIQLEEKIFRANKEFEEWRRQLINQKLSGFKPLDEKMRKEFSSFGWEYDEEMSKIIYLLAT